MLSVIDISKKYNTQTALDAVSFSLNIGEVCGLLGPNGAGKSTLLKIITTYLKPDQGEVLFNGASILENQNDYRKKIGYLPEHNPLYLDQYVTEYLRFIASFYNCPAANITNTIEATGLTDFAQKKIGSLSKGYRQRVGLAAAIVHEPKILILDEPTTGLDPNQIVEIRQLIKSISATKIVLLSTHLMQEVDAICDRVLILNEGKLVEDNTLNQVKLAQGQVLLLETDRLIEEAIFYELPGFILAKNLRGQLWEIHFSAETDARSLLFDLAIKHGFKMLQLTAMSDSMESIFRQKTTTN
jgi:ABC-2 type transport system ATP-binding protein